MKKQTLSILLALLMTASAFVSCSSAEEKDTSADTTPTAAETEAAAEESAESVESPAETEEASLFEKLTDDLPALTYDGFEFNMLTRGHAIAVNEMGVDEINGEAVNDAIYNRNAKVGERFDVNIVREYRDTGDHGPGDVQTLVTAGDTHFDLVVGSCYGIMPSTTNNIYYDLNTLENLDLSSPAWSQGIRETATIAGKTFAATGSIALTYFQRNYAIFFNKNLSESHGIMASDVYNTVLEGKWTLDEMFTLTKDIYVDENGNGVTDDQDTYGIGVWLNCMNDGWWSACDIPMIKHDENDLLYLDLDIDKLSVVNNKLKDYIWNNNGVCEMSEDTIYSTEIPVDNINDVNIFYEDQMCFTTMRIEFTERGKMRNMESDYGVLPYPKYDEAQETYYGFIHDAVSMVLVPGSAPDPQLSGLIMQALAVESHNSVMPVYYEVVLTNKYIRDRESVEMLNIIYRNTKFDSGWIFCSAMNELPQQMLRLQVWQNKDTLASQYRTMKKVLEKGSLKNLNEGYQNAGE